MARLQCYLATPGNRKGVKTMTKRKKLIIRVMSLTMAVMLTASVAYSSPAQAMEPFGIVFGWDTPDPLPP